MSAVWNVPGARQSLRTRRSFLADATAVPGQTKASVAYRYEIERLIESLVAARAADRPHVQLALAQVLTGHDRPPDPACESTYEYALVISLQAQASWGIALEQNELALDCLEAAWQLLDVSDARPDLSLGGSTLNADLRHCLLGTLAYAKWNCANSRRDLILSPEDMVNVWQIYANRFRMTCEGRACTGSLRTHGENLLWSGLWVAACSWRWCEVFTFSVVNEINRLHRAHFTGRNCLAHSEFYFRSHPPVDADSPLYWQYELCKAEIENHVKRGRPADHKLQPVELMNLLEQLAAAAQFLGPAEPRFLAAVQRRLRELPKSHEKQTPWLEVGRVAQRR